MEYECGFVRRHKTRTRPHKVGERSLELPIVELGAMRLEIQGEPPALADVTGQEDFVAQVLAMVDQHSHLTIRSGTLRTFAEHANTGSVYRCQFRSRRKALSQTC
jgi:hypothetical protein